MQQVHLFLLYITYTCRKTCQKKTYINCLHNLNFVASNEGFHCRVNVAALLHAAVLFAESPEGSCAVVGGLQAWDFAPRSHQQGGKGKKPSLHFCFFMQSMLVELKRKPQTWFSFLGEENLTVKFVGWGTSSSDASAPPPTLLVIIVAFSLQKLMLFGLYRPLWIYSQYKVYV